MLGVMSNSAKNVSLTTDSKTSASKPTCRSNNVAWTHGNSSWNGIVASLALGDASSHTPMPAMMPSYSWALATFLSCVTCCVLLGCDTTLVGMYVHCADL